MTRGADDELAELLVDRALLEGDFVLRSGKRSSWYLDKYRFETEPELLRALGIRLAEAVSEFEPDADRLAGPALGGVALAASASLASDRPFIIVRGEAKEYGTANRIEGPFERGSSCASWRTSSPPAAPSWTPSRPSGRRACSCGTRSASSIVRTAGPTLSRASACVCGRSFGRASSWNCEKPQQNGMVEPNTKGC